MSVLCQLIYCHPSMQRNLVEASTNRNNKKTELKYGLYEYFLAIMLLIILLLCMNSTV